MVTKVEEKPRQSETQVGRPGADLDRADLHAAGAETSTSRIADLRGRHAVRTESDHLSAELETFGIVAHRFGLEAMKDLRDRVDMQCERDPEFNATHERSEIRRLLQARINAAELLAEVGTIPSSVASSSVALKGAATDGVQAVLKALRGSLGADDQIVIRGGSLSEGLGWLQTGPDGDPRVPPGQSTYTRRTGTLVPAYDLTDAARSSSRAVASVVDDAMRYGRSGNLAEQAGQYLEEQLGRFPSKEEMKELLYADDEELPFERDRSRGVLMVFADAEETYDPSFHRNDPQWNNSSYDYAVTMESGTRHIKAILPIPEHQKNFPEGAFAMIITPEILAMPQEVQKSLFDAAFRDFDRDKYNSILAAESASRNAA